MSPSARHVVDTDATRVVQLFGLAQHVDPGDDLHTVGDADRQVRRAPGHGRVPAAAAEPTPSTGSSLARHDRPASATPRSRRATRDSSRPQTADQPLDSPTEKCSFELVWIRSRHPHPPSSGALSRTNTPRLKIAMNRQGYRVRCVWSATAWWERMGSSCEQTLRPLQLALRPAHEYLPATATNDPSECAVGSSQRRTPRRRPIRATTPKAIAKAPKTVPASITVSRTAVPRASTSGEPPSHSIVSPST